MSIFLTTTDTRHSLLYKRKIFRNKTQTKLTSNSSKLTGASHDEPIDVDNQQAAADDDDVQILREGDDDDPDQRLINLDDIPDAHEMTGSRRFKRRRHNSTAAPEGQQQHSDEDPDSDDEESDEQLFVSGGGEDENDSDAGEGPPPPKRRRGKDRAPDDEETDDKKKLAMDISYEGFGIYGRILCLVIKRREGGKTMASSSSGAGASGTSRSQAPGRPGGQASMENWIASTQMPETAGEEPV